jgi:hypothetical protein
LKSANVQAMELDNAGEVGVAEAGALVVAVAGADRDVARLHGESLDWMFDIPVEQYTAVPPAGYVFVPLVSHSTLCLLTRCLAETI